MPPPSKSSPLTTFVEGRDVLLVGRDAEHAELEAARRVCHVEAVETLREKLEEERELYDAALITGWADTWTPVKLASEVRERVRPGGTLAFSYPTFLHPTRRGGLKRAGGALMGMIKRRRPVDLEDLTEGLLHAGLEDIRAAIGGGVTGDSLVWAIVRADSI